MTEATQLSYEEALIKSIEWQMKQNSINAHDKKLWFMQTIDMKISNSNKKW